MHIDNVIMSSTCNDCCSTKVLRIITSTRRNLINELAILYNYIKEISYLLEVIGSALSA